MNLEISMEKIRKDKMYHSLLKLAAVFKLYHATQIFKVITKKLRKFLIKKLKVKKSKIGSET